MLVFFSTTFFHQHSSILQGNYTCHSTLSIHIMIQVNCVGDDYSNQTKQIDVLHMGRVWSVICLKAYAFRIIKHKIAQITRMLNVNVLFSSNSHILQYFPRLTLQVFIIKCSVHYTKIYWVHRTSFIRLFYIIRNSYRTQARSLFLIKTNSSVLC